MSSPDTEFRPRPLSKRTWIRLTAIALVVAVLYGLVAFFYNAEGGVKLDAPTNDATAGLLVRVDPVNVNAQTNVLSTQFAFTPLGEMVDNDGHLKENVRVVIDSWQGAKELRFAKGSVPSPTTVELGMTGEQAQYPFDTHEAAGFVTADTFTKEADGSITSVDVVPVTIAASNGVNGWDTVVTADALMASTNLDLSFSRAFSTQIFALMLLALAVVLAAATVVVAFLVASQRRRAEVGLMAWTAALLFALPALRTFMPNSPPIGAAIDMYVYLWVMAGAIAAATIMIVSWVRQSGRALKEADHAS